MTCSRRIILTYFFPFLFLNFTASAQEEPNQLDTENRRHGLWKEFFDPQKQMPKFEGEYNHGKEVGMFKFYKEGLNNPSATMIFSPKSDSVTVKYLSQNDKTISEGIVVDKERTGIWTYYHKNSDKVMMTETYRDGKLQGPKKVYYEDGTLAEEANYLDGQLHGQRKLFSVKGVVLEDLIYKQGELHGPAKFFNGKGELTTEGSYKDNKHHGTWRYYENGILKEEKEF